LGLILKLLSKWLSHVSVGMTYFKEVVKCMHDD